jgi:FKBP-type peptidyl-prolyl cis-trans isomerase SlyD
MIFKAGTYVRIRYTLRIESGEIVKGDPKDSLEYMDFITGFNQVLPGLESRLIGLEQGERVMLRIPPDEAFGQYDPSLAQEKTFDEFPEGRSLEAGKWVMATNEQYRIRTGYLVRKKGPSSITVDYNHPLAGKTLIYEVMITEERPARQDELALVKPCDFEPGNRNKVIDTFLGNEEQ